MKTISPAYLDEQRRLHDAPYGSSAHYWLGHVLELCEIFEIRTVLDYGAGKGTLGPYLTRFGIEYTPYDPATFPKRPEGFHDLTVCLDVLEHVEEAYLNNVFEDIRNHTGKVFFSNVATRPSTKVLSDGRNAHLIQKDYEWWRPRFKDGWIGGRTRQHPGAFDVVVIRKPPPSGYQPVPREQIDRLRGNFS